MQKFSLCIIDDKALDLTELRLTTSMTDPEANLLPEEPSVCMQSHQPDKQTGIGPGDLHKDRVGYDNFQRLKPLRKDFDAKIESMIVKVVCLERKAGIV